MNDKNNQVSSTNEDEVIVQTGADTKDGQTKCPKCGATDISLNESKGMLRCNFCRHEFEPEKAVEETNLKDLKGKVVGSGAQDIKASKDDLLTIECSSCGAEVVINTNEATNARCHWCRNVLSVNRQIPNGSVPDMVLPFKLKKDEAKSAIDKFVGSRMLFAHPKFKKEFTTQNIMGAYFPYMIVNANAHVHLSGHGEIKVKEYAEGEGSSKKTYYDADCYKVEREFDLTVNGLTVESSSDKRQYQADKTNNIINAIMPFDIENCVKWDANYLRGYSTEKRDTNISDLKDLFDVQAKDIARYKANETIKKYDRGVKWENEKLDLKGQAWNSAYLPVWLYSYQQEMGKKGRLHYIAVNARTKEIIGSVPLHLPKLWLVVLLIEALAVAIMLYFNWAFDWIFIPTGFIFLLVIYNKYRNTGAVHTYERETTSEMSNVKEVDNFIEKRTRLTSMSITGANNRTIDRRPKK